jgi:methylmalonyl-CoA/ethylmalonyl-CoA epimerase
MHHICLRVSNIRQTMARLTEQGFELLSEEPQRGAHDCLVCFVHPKSTGGVLLELSEPAGS